MKEPAPIRLGALGVGRIGGMHAELVARLAAWRSVHEGRPVATAEIG